MDLVLLWLFGYLQLLSVQLILFLWYAPSLRFLGSKYLYLVGNSVYVHCNLLAVSKGDGNHRSWIHRLVHIPLSALQGANQWPSELPLIALFVFSIKLMACSMYVCRKTGMNYLRKSSTSRGRFLVHLLTDFMNASADFCQFCLLHKWGVRVFSLCSQSDFSLDVTSIW